MNIVLIKSLSLNLPLACSACFYGDTNTSAMIGLRMGVLLLMAVVLFIFVLFIKFFLNFAKRSKLNS